MKISTSRLFDTQKIIDAFKAAKVEGIDDFVTNLSDLSDQIVRILRNRVSLQDNVDCVVKEIELQHNVSLALGNPSEKRTIQHIVPSRSSSFDNPVSAIAWEYSGDGSIKLKAQLLGAPTGKVKVTLIMYY